VDRLLWISTTSNPDKCKRSYPERAVQGNVEVVVSACSDAVHVAGDVLISRVPTKSHPGLDPERHPKAHALSRVVI
jgi:hypothetical protein